MKRNNFLLLLFAIVVITLASVRVALRTWPWIPTVVPLVTNEQEDTLGAEDEVPDTNTTSKEIGIGKEVPFQVTLPQNFKIGIFAEGLGSPRVLLLDSKGRLLVSIPSQGKVVSLSDEDGDGFAELNKTIISGLNRPHGMAFHNGFLYIAETGNVSLYSYDEEDGAIGGGYSILSLPTGGRHFTRTIGFDREGKLYISIGSSCDTCLEDDERRAAIMVADSDGANFRVYASGLRNSVFFRWHPETEELFATEMGRDFLGDNLPPDEVNIIREGKGYGWPFCFGKKIYDTVFRGVNNCALSEGSFIDLPAHVAPLGLAFAPHEWGKEWENDLLVAFHGSWNSSVPVGYKVVRFDYEDGKYSVSGEDFVTGFIAGDDVLGRPVDLLFDRDRLYISDDKRGVIYTVVKSR